MRVTLCNKLFGAVALACLVQTMSAAVIPVRTAAEIRSAQAKARPGDILEMQSGEWRDAEIVFEANGTPEQPVTLRAQTSGQMVLTGRSRLRMAGRHLVAEGLLFKGGVLADDEVIAFRTSTTKTASFSRVTGCAVVDYNASNRATDYKWLSLYGVSNRVDHCYFAGKNHAGTTLVVWVSDQPNDHQIDHNHFGPRPRLGANGGETIRVGDSANSMKVSRTRVEFNLFEKCNGEVEIVSNKSCENIYRHNTFIECEGAMTLRHGNRCRVEGNFFLGRNKPNTGGVRVIGEDHRVVNNYFAGLTGEESRAALSLMNGVPNSPLHKYFQVQRLLVAFNTFARCRNNLVIGLKGESRATLPPTDVTFANNVMVAAERGAVVEVVTPPVKTAWLGNFFHGGTGNWRVPDGVTMLDPGLAQADGLHRPGAGSPAIGAAKGSFPDITEDIDGQPRGEKKDAGCDQLATNPVKYRPLSAKETGPAWLAR